MGRYELVDEQFAAFQASGRTPGVVWGLVEGGELVHFGAAGVATTAAAAPPLTDRSIFRIASMTKSFTAAAILLLRDRGLLRLDDPVADHVPELRSLVLPIADSAPLTLRHLLTMAGGLPTDDPWADRQESMGPADYSALLAGGFTFNDPPGTHFSYSNLGYTILGRVIENVARGSYAEFVRAELLVPLGMASTTFDYAEVDQDVLVPGHRNADGAWQAVPFTGPGAFSPLGGILSSVSELARWVAGFLDAFPPRSDAESGHPLSRASRREMQQLHQFVDVAATLTPPGATGAATLAATAAGYGFGLVVEHFTDLGQVVSHSGGYPGYGSRMRWHPASGVGVITLSNATYSGAEQAARNAIRMLAAQRTTAYPVPTRAVDTVNRLLDGYDSAGTFPTSPADGPFADNVDLDHPPVERLASLAKGVALVGESLPERSAAVSRDPAHATWSVPAANGRRDVEIRLTPENPPRIQTLKITAVPAAPERLTFFARALVKAIEGGGWPDDVPVTDAVDKPQFERAAELARSFGAAELVEEPVAGDGALKAEFGVRTGDLWWSLALTAAEDGRLSASAFRPATALAVQLLKRLTAS